MKNIYIFPFSIILAMLCISGKYTISDSINIELCDSSSISSSKESCGFNYLESKDSLCVSKAYFINGFGPKLTERLESFLQDERIMDYYEESNYICIDITKRGEYIVVYFELEESLENLDLLSSISFFEYDGRLCLVTTIGDLADYVRTDENQTNTIIYKKTNLIINDDSRTTKAFLFRDGEFVEIK